MAAFANSQSDDIVRSTLAEICIFLLLFSLFLMLSPNPSPIQRELFKSDPLELYFATGLVEFEEGQNVDRVLQEVAKKLILDLDESGGNVIEVIGHTDHRILEERRAIKDRATQPFGENGTRCKLDSCLIEVLEGDSDFLEFRSNAGLGLARAVVVARRLKRSLAEANKDAGGEGIINLDAIELHPLSASYLYDPNTGRLDKETHAKRRERLDSYSRGTLSDEQTKPYRRIELRIRKLD